MTRITAGTFSAKIPAMPNQATVEYRTIAYDNFNNSAVSDNQELLYRYTVIPEPFRHHHCGFDWGNLLAAAFIKRRKVALRVLLLSW